MSTPAAALLWRVVPALGITQIVGWGSLYYSVAVLAAPMAESLGVAQSLVFGAFSLALVVSGMAAPLAGRAIDRLGGRRVLAAGSAVGALALAVIALADSVAVFLGGWALAGLAMAACLYDAAFPALSQLAGTHYRRALTALTLFGGLASTVFWPLAWALHEAWGWRSALGGFALLHLLVCLPLHRWALPAATPSVPTPGKAETTETTETIAPTAPRGLVWLGLALSGNAFVFSAIGAHVVGALGMATGVASEAVWIAALIGPMQVGGRIVEFLFASRWSAIRVGVAALSATVLGMLLLWQAGSAAWVPMLFAVCYGAANGVMTIVRGTVPAELYGREAYGQLMGRLAQPAFFAKAAAPLAVSLLLGSGASYADMALALALLSALALGAYGMAVRMQRGLQGQPGGAAVTR
ncbi:MFS transporter [Uliginosibacterium sp. H1]|uniref:MFS transporter n=1 Tax=Uliginosibacterium sp. H1 TaxID=3114757 RepID=UPI002E17B782|nr:MFS transporter [Uliginosibacterium sp. H1]